MTFSSDCKDALELVAERLGVKADLIQHRLCRARLHDAVKPAASFAVAFDDDRVVRIDVAGVAPRRRLEGVQALVVLVRDEVGEFFEEEEAVFWRGRWDEVVEVDGLGESAAEEDGGSPNPAALRQRDSAQAMRILTHQAHWRNSSMIVSFRCTR